MLLYPVELKPDGNNTIIATFPDFPEGVTFGGDEEDALFHSVDAIETCISSRMNHREPVPAPSPAVGRHTVLLPALISAKVLLYQAMMASGVRKAELARRMNLHASQLDRMLSITRSSKIEEIERALSALGKRLVVDIT
jgi:antitoxin HicB